MPRWSFHVAKSGDTNSRNGLLPVPVVGSVEVFAGSSWEGLFLPANNSGPQNLREALLLFSAQTASRSRGVDLALNTGLNASGIFISSL